MFLSYLPTLFDMSRSEFWGISDFYFAPPLILKKNLHPLKHVEKIWKCSVIYVLYFLLGEWIWKLSSDLKLRLLESNTNTLARPVGLDSTLSLKWVNPYSNLWPTYPSPRGQLKNSFWNYNWIESWFSLWYNSVWYEKNEDNGNIGGILHIYDFHHHKHWKKSCLEAKTGKFILPIIVLLGSSEYSLNCWTVEQVS